MLLFLITLPESFAINNQNGTSNPKNCFKSLIKLFLKIHILVGFQLVIFITVVLGIFFGILDQFGWQYLFLVAHIG